MYCRSRFYSLGSLKILFSTDVHQNMKEHPRTFLTRELDLIQQSEKDAVNDMPHT